MRLYFTKTQQWTKAAATMKYLEKSMPHTSVELRDKLAVAKLQQATPTFPWEYPWAEVVRSQRERRRT